MVCNWQARRLVQGLAFLVILAGTASARGEGKASADWPGWRGPERNGVAAAGDWKPVWTASPKILWKASVGKGFSSLAAVGDRVYTMGNQDDTDNVFCLDAATGKVLWKHSYHCSLTPLAYEGGPSATPVVDGQRAYTLSKSGHLFCLDSRSGKVVWSKKFELALRKEGDYHVDWGYAASPLVLGEKLIVSVGWAGMALNKNDGTVLWDNGLGRPGYSSPVPFVRDGRPYLAMLVARGAVAVEAERGKIAWTIPWRTTWDQNAPDVVVFDQKLFVSTGHGVGCALFDIAGDSPKELWRNKSMRNELSSSVLWKGFLYGFDNNRLACLDAQTGKGQWSAPGLGRGSLIAVNGYLIVLGEKGNMVIAPATQESYRPLGDAWPVLAGRCWTAPAFSRGRLLVRDAEGNVACLDLRPQVADAQVEGSLKAMGEKGAGDSKQQFKEALTPTAKPKALEEESLTARQKRLDEAIKKLADATNEIERSYALGDAAKACFEAGKVEDARKYTKELLATAAKFPGVGTCGHAIHDGHLVLGRIALAEGKTEEAKKHLLEAGKTPGSPVLDSFGPNMSLARDLLKKGERQAVLDYFERCRTFWKMGHDRLDQWTKDVDAGRTPDFGANLDY